MGPAPGRVDEEAFSDADLRGAMGTGESPRPLIPIRLSPLLLLLSHPSSHPLASTNTYFVIAKRLRISSTSPTSFRRRINRPAALQRKPFKFPAPANLALAPAPSAPLLAISATRSITIPCCPQSRARNRQPEVENRTNGISRFTPALDVALNNWTPTAAVAAMSIPLLGQRTASQRHGKLSRLRNSKVMARNSATAQACRCGSEHPRRPEVPEHPPETCCEGLSTHTAGPNWAADSRCSGSRRTHGPLRAASQALQARTWQRFSSCRGPGELANAMSLSTAPMVAGPLDDGSLFSLVLTPSPPPPTRFLNSPPREAGRGNLVCSAVSRLQVGQLLPGPQFAEFSLPTHWHFLHGSPAGLLSHGCSPTRLVVPSSRSKHHHIRFPTLFASRSGFCCVSSNKCQPPAYPPTSFVDDPWSWHVAQNLARRTPWAQTTHPPALRWMAPCCRTLRTEIGWRN
ncbi:hypothetical protein G7Y89_g3192 [Cudoniella acicularis]|uniref:Uncharacterized protein n=1 Tax=Cudoniella acicularis TaxID=354080 RepID=A0A8H4RUU8_9HELO|nr:hypothetical protein G7Y89_g3192 [Cudoniella acicularis]